VQVVDRHERQAAPPGEGLGGGEPDEKRADQTGALRDRDGLEVVQAGLRPLERLADDRKHELEVPPRGDLGNDAAEARVQVRLRGRDRRPKLPVDGDERPGGLVARGLEPQDQGCAAASGTGSFHMISASSRLSV